MANVESDYSSSSDEDDDYVPSGEDESYDELEGTVEEEEGIQEKDGGKQKKKGSKDSTSRRRKAWTALVDERKDEKGEDEASNIQRELEAAEKEEARRKKEEAEKKKADDLWSSFLSGVNQKPKSSQAQISKVTKSATPSSQKAPSSKQSETPTLQSNGSKADSTLKITKVFDFAGEAVQVTKEVAASSKEAKNYLKEQEVKDSPTKSDMVPGSSNTGSAVVPGLQGCSSKPTISSGLKRSAGGLGSVLGQIGKKQKISTLEKSRLDWESFKSKEGITDELKIHNKGKDGFVERQRFLQRADVRQYEIERDLRMAQTKILR